MGSASEDCRFDGLFTSVAEQAGGIENLFDLFFGFLFRRTDFLTAGTDKCRTLLDCSFNKWTDKAKEAEQRKQQEHQKAQKEKERLRAQQDDLESRPKVEELTEEEERQFAEEEKGSCDSDSKTPEAPKPDRSEENDTDEDDESCRPEGNGGTTDRYRWTQTLGTVDVYIPVPSGTRAGLCSVKITPSRLLVCLKGQAPIIGVFTSVGDIELGDLFRKSCGIFSFGTACCVCEDGEFCQRVRADDSMWTLEDGKTLHLSLEKVDNMRWWSCVVKGDPEIDTKKIVPENSKLSDLDPETRATVEKMMYDQQQKQRGLPTSDQQKQAEMLEKFKKAHPELDFSNAKINWGNSAWSG